MAGWDNTARRMLSSVARYGAAPALFRLWLREVVFSEGSRKCEGEMIIFLMLGMSGRNLSEARNTDYGQD